MYKQCQTNKFIFQEVLYLSDVPTSRLSISGTTCSIVSIRDIGSTDYYCVPYSIDFSIYFNIWCHLGFLYYVDIFVLYS